MSPDGDELAERASPLTEADLDDINRALVRLEDAASLIDKSQQAGIDVEPFRQRARERRDQLLKIKGAFFPGR